MAQDFAQKCRDQLGVDDKYVLKFNCREDGGLINSGKALLFNESGHEEPYPSYMGRIEDSRFPDVKAVFFCRKEPGYPIDQSINSDEFNDIAIIQTNIRTGKTCFYQALMDPGNDAARIPPTPLNGAAIPDPINDNERFWETPAVASDVDCHACHDNDPFIRSPYIDNVSDFHRYGLPERTPTQLKEFPYSFVGEDFSDWRVFEVKAANPTPNERSCTDCHRMAFATNHRYSTRRGSARILGPIFSHAVPTDHELSMDHSKEHALALRDCANAAYAQRIAGGDATYSSGDCVVKQIPTEHPLPKCRLTTHSEYYVGQYARIQFEVLQGKVQSNFITSPILSGVSSAGGEVLLAVRSPGENEVVGRIADIFGRVSFCRTSFFARSPDFDRHIDEYHSGCLRTSSSQSPNCIAAVHRACVEKGYDVGLPQEVGDGYYEIGCVTAQSYGAVSIATLAQYHPKCDDYGLAQSADCAAAAHRFCEQNGFGHLSFLGEPQEVNPNFLEIGCFGTPAQLDSGQILYRNVSVSHLESYHFKCDSASKSQSPNCVAAVHRYCNDHGKDMGTTQEVGPDFFVVGCFDAGFKGIVSFSN